jgi:hypothetical protein
MKTRKQPQAVASDESPVSPRDIVCTGTEWACEVWVYGSPSGVVYEATLPDVMRVVCEEYGTD